MSVKKNNKLSLVVLMAIVFVVIVALIVILVKSIDQSVYSGKQSILKEVSEASANTVDSMISAEMKFARNFANEVEIEISEEDTLTGLIEKLNNIWEIGEDLYFLVDEDGMYYSSDMQEGVLEDYTYYLPDTDQEVKYLGGLPQVESETEFLIFRIRLDNPAEIEHEGRTLKITYFSLMYNLRELNAGVASLYGGMTNTFLYETASGKMLYKRFGLGLLEDGFNVYDKLNRMELPHGEDSEELVNACMSDNTVIAEMTISGESYYMCSSSLVSNDWSLLVIVRKESIVDGSEEGFRNVIGAIAVIAVLLGMSVVAVVAMSYKSKAAIANAKAAGKNEQSRTGSVAVQSSGQGNTGSRYKFLLGMSHDLKVPLTAMAGFTDLARKHIDDKEKVEECLSKTRKMIGEQFLLIDDILESGRIDEGKVILAETGADIGQIFRGSVGTAENLSESKQITVKSEYMNVRNPQVFVDSRRFQRIMMNVIEKTILHSDEGTAIYLRMMQDGAAVNGEAMYTFEADGSSSELAPDFTTSIFEEIVQSDADKSEDSENVEIGMSRCKALATLMGGSLTAEVKNDTGFRFTVKIPMRIQEDAPKGESAKAKADRIVTKHIDSLKGRNVLLAEDNDFNREIVKESLEDYGAAVDEARDGLEVLDRIKENGTEHYDFILMDIQMPGMDGYAASKEIRKLYPESRIPIFALSANEFEDGRQMSYIYGMDEFFEKPLNMGKLMTVLGKYL